MFYCIASTAMYKGGGSPGGIAALAAALAPPIFASSVALWVLADARRRRRSLPYDFGAFVFFTWAVLVPIYLFRTRGWRAFAVLGWFLLLYLSAVLFGSIPYLFLATAHL